MAVLDANSLERLLPERLSPEDLAGRASYGRKLAHPDSVLRRDVIALCWRQRRESRLLGRRAELRRPGLVFVNLPLLDEVRLRLAPYTNFGGIVLNQDQPGEAELDPESRSERRKHAP